MKKRSWLRVAAALAVASLASHASAQEAWKIGTVVAPPSMLGVIVDEAAAGVGRATGGRITAERFQNPNEQELTQNILRGRLEMGYISATGMAVAVPEMGVLNMPYLWRSEGERDYVLDKVIPPLLEQIMTARGLTLLKIGEAGWTNLFCKIACTTPDRMKGMKMRIQPSPVFKTLVESLGASASAIPWAELPTALQQKVVDGQENGVSNILAASLYQHQKYATLDGHVYSIHAYMVNERFYQGLTAAERKAVDEGVAKATAIHRKITADYDKNAKAVLEKNGMQVYVPTAAQIGEFRKLAQPPVRAWAESEIGKAYVDDLFKAIGATRQ